MASVKSVSLCNSLNNCNNCNSLIPETLSLILLLSFLPFVLPLHLTVYHMLSLSLSHSPMLPIRSSYPSDLHRVSAGHMT